MNLKGLFMEENMYTPKEEFLNAFTHSLGALFSIYAIVMLAVNSKTSIEAASTAVFGATLFILFQSSTLYHAMVNETAKKVFRKIDHSAIFMLIAGTYTPVLLLTVKFPLSVAIMSMTWYLAISGIIYSCLTLKFKYLSTGLYLVMGWLSVFLAYTIWTKAGQNAFWLMLAGGLLYSGGCIFYLSKKRYMHCIWHLFVLAGAISHYMSVMQLLKTAA